MTFTIAASNCATTNATFTYPAGAMAITQGPPLELRITFRPESERPSWCSLREWRKAQAHVRRLIDEGRTTELVDLMEEIRRVQRDGEK